MREFYLFVGLPLIALCGVSCSAQQAAIEPPAPTPVIADDSSEDAWAWKYMDPFGEMLTDQQKARAEIDASDFIASGGDMENRSKESAAIIKPMIDVAPLKYSASVKCTAAYWVAAEGRLTTAAHASNRIGSIVYVTFTSTPAHDEIPFNDRASLDNFRERIYADYLIYLNDVRKEVLMNSDWPISAMEECDAIFPEPQ